MRYVEGRDLKERLQHGCLDPADATGILAQVASALDAAHARGLVHRDVKPSNVLLDIGARPDGSDHVYLADFGLTKRISEEPGIAEDGHLMGTIDYVAPEQIAGDVIDGRADVYSLGCVLYECLVGQPPFRGDSDLAVVFAHLEAEAPAPSAQRPELPAALDAVVARALAKDPEQRYASCRVRPSGARGRGRRGEPRARRRRLMPPPAKRPEQRRGRVDRQGYRPAIGARAGAGPVGPGHPSPCGQGGSARSRASRASSPSMRTTSSAASGSSPS